MFGHREGQAEVTSSSMRGDDLPFHTGWHVLLLWTSRRL